jgi:hypothetical protein
MIFGPQGLQAHQPLDPVQIAFDAICQKVSPNTPWAVGSVAGKEAGLHLLADHSVASDLARGDRFGQA